MHGMTPRMGEQLRRAREMSWQRFGKRLTFYIPGMFRCGGISGLYPAVSITGDHCALRCDHCGGLLLKTMIPAVNAEELVELGLRLHRDSRIGVLISGGCDRSGRLPWPEFIPAIKRLKDKTGLFLSVHCGLLDRETARALKGAGVDQALIDVIGDDETYQTIYHVDFGVGRIRNTLEALSEAGLPVIPHIVCGLRYGRLQGESRALEMIADFSPQLVVIVSYMKIPGTRTHLFEAPRPEEVAEIISEARFRMPEVPLSLGCARERGNTHMETLAIDAGVNRMALPSDEALLHARGYGLEVRYQRTCCSVSRDVSTASLEGKGGGAL